MLIEVVTTGADGESAGESASPLTLPLVPSCSPGPEQNSASDPFPSPYQHQERGLGSDILRGVADQPVEPIDQVAPPGLGGQSAQPALVEAGKLQLIPDHAQLVRTVLRFVPEPVQLGFDTLQQSTSPHLLVLAPHPHHDGAEVDERAHVPDAARPEPCYTANRSDGRSQRR